MEIINYFSENIYKELEQILRTADEDTLEEIRIRANKNIILKFNNNELVLTYKASTEDILETLEKITENSIYSYEKQINQGYITLRKGHRVGIVGNAINENNSITNISYISGMNFRIARQIKGCSDFILNDVYNNRIFKNTIILGSPGTGKTTLLRDLIRQISNGNSQGEGVNVGVVDERNEISAMYKGIEQNDLGIRTDTISGISKHVGIKIMIRSMRPDVIAVDEIGSKDDTEILQYAMCSGVKVLLTAHGNDLQDVLINDEINKIFRLRIIERIIILDSQKKIKDIYYLNKNKKEYERKWL